MYAALASWRTTAAGIAGFVVALGMALTATWDSDPATTADWNTVVVALTAMIGLIVARDSVVTSEDARAETSPETVAILRAEGKDVTV